MRVKNFNAILITINKRFPQVKVSGKRFNRMQNLERMYKVEKVIT